MNHEVIRAKMQKYFEAATPEEVVESFRKLGCSFVTTESEWKKIHNEFYFNLTGCHDGHAILHWLIENKKIFIQISPVDSWEEWQYTILMEDSCAPFFEMYKSSKYEDSFISYQVALECALIKVYEYLTCLDS